MRNPWRTTTHVFVLTVAFGLGFAAFAQQTPSPPEKPEDPFGRHTPRSSLANFLRAAEAGNYERAAEYLQLTPSQKRSRGVRAAKELQAVINSGYRSRILAVSDSEQGEIDDGLPGDRENAGELVVADSAVTLTMVRVDGGADFGQIWLVSRETLREIPALSEKIPAFTLAESLPEQLHTRFRGMALYQWLGVLILLAVAFLLAWVVVLAGARIARRLGADLPKLPWPLVVLLTLFIHARMLPFLQVPLLYRANYSSLIAVLLLLGIAWLLMRGVDAGSEMAQQKALQKGNLSAGSWIILARRMLKGIVFAMATLSLLSMFGVNVTTALAGLGIGGIAIGFGAQKTIENLFGGISVATDQVIRVGDVCDFNGRVGVITDIGLRSTRMKTLERTELSVPNGVLANMNVDNLSRREKFLFRTTIGLLYRTTTDQLEQVLREIRELLASDGRVEWPGGRVNFIAFADSSLNIEIFCYIQTPDFAQFVTIREELLLKIMQIVDHAGTGFAFPSRTIYVRRDDDEILSEASAPAKTHAP
jgi:MscS family membrane protein